MDALFCESRKIPTATAETQVYLINIYLSLQQAQLSHSPGVSDGVNNVQHSQASGLRLQGSGCSMSPFHGLAKSPRSPNVGTDFYECLATAKDAGDLVSSFLKLWFPTNKLG